MVRQVLSLIVFMEVPSKDLWFAIFNLPEKKVSLLLIFTSLYQINDHFKTYKWQKCYKSKLETTTMAI